MIHQDDDPDLQDQYGVRVPFFGDEHSDFTVRAKNGKASLLFMDSEVISELTEAEINDMILALDAVRQVLLLRAALEEVDAHA